MSKASISISGNYHNYIIYHIYLTKLHKVQGAMRCFGSLITFCKLQINALRVT